MTQSPTSNGSEETKRQVHVERRDLGIHIDEHDVVQVQAHNVRVHVAQNVLQRHAFARLEVRNALQRHVEVLVEHPVHNSANVRRQRITSALVDRLLCHFLVRHGRRLTCTSLMGQGTVSDCSSGPEVR